MIVLLDGLRTVVNYLIALMDGKFTASVADFNETDPSSLSYIKNKSVAKQWVADKILESTADWEQHDASQPDYIKNRTHYDSRVYGGIFYTFDGDMSGYESVDLGGVYLVKITEDTPSVDSLIGSTVKIYSSGTTQEETITSDLVQTFAEGVYLIADYIYLTHQTFTDGGITLTPGIWVMYMPSDSVWVSEISSYGLISGELKQIDPKYLPILQPDWAEEDETSKAYILNKPDVSDTHLTLFDEEYSCFYRIEMKRGNLVSILDVEKTLIDFEYTANDDGTYTLTSWKGTYRGEPSTRIIVPNSDLFIV